MNEREVLIARADKYLNTGSGEYASEIMRDMAEFIRRMSQPASVAQSCPRCGELETEVEALKHDIERCMGREASLRMQPSEQERHAIGHARYQVERATPEFPEVCFDYELILTLLKIIDRASQVTSSEPLPPDWKQDQAETSRLAPRVSSTHQSAPVLRAAHNSGEGDLQVTADCAGADTRCPICDWPFAESAEKGCVPGDCSYRPDDPTEQARIKRRRAELSSTEGK